MMEDIDKLVGVSMSEIEKLLSTKSAVGDPITVGDQTVVPLMSIGFAFGAGGGSGKGSGKNDKSSKGNEGSGEGGLEATGGVGGIRPVAAIIIDSNGARLESVRGGASNFVETIGDAVGNVIEKRSESKQD